MKAYSKIFQLACLVALMGATAGCADEALVEQTNMENPTVSNNQPVMVQATVPEGNSRISYTEGEYKLTLKWEEGDQFSVFDPNNYDGSTVFTINTDEEGERYANFTGVPTQAFTDGSLLYALYPAVATGYTANDHQLLDLSVQDGTLDDSKQFMLATATYTAGSMPVFNFQSLVSIMKLELNFPSDVTTIKSVILKSSIDEGTLTAISSIKGLNLKAGFPGTYPEDNSPIEYTVTRENNFSLTGNKLTVYIYMFGAQGLYPAVIATDVNGKQYANSFKGRDVEEGKMLVGSVSMIPIVPFANETSGDGDGTKEKPFEIANLAQWNSLAARTAVNMDYNDERKFTECHYKLTSDIVLSETDVVYPVGGHTGYKEHNGNYNSHFAGSFDGCGHQFTGVLNLSGTNHESIGLFSNLINGSIHDLHLNTTAGDLYEPSYAFGGIVGVMAEGDVWGCSNTMSVSFTNTKYVGGIVGTNITDMNNYGSTIDGCWSSADLSSSSTESFVGGIAGALTMDVRTRACYTTGSAQGGTVGGLIGAMYDSAITLGCWSDMDLTCNMHKGGIVGYMSNLESYGNRTMYLLGCYYSDSSEVNVYGSMYEDDACNYVIENNAQLGDESNQQSPTVEQIAAMNEQLKDNSYDSFYRSTSTYKFNSQGKPVQETTSGGSANGNNFGNGGEF